MICFNRILMWVVPSCFFIAMAVVTYSGFNRQSGITGLDPAKIQEMRIREMRMKK